MTLLLVLRYVSHLKAEGYSFYSRRHRLVMVRRATRMAASYGFADPLAGMVVDRSEARAEPEAWTLEELITGLRALVEEKHERALAATALGGLLGLRSSEIFRVRVGDVGAEVVRVGARERKNAASRRDLPIPRVVRPWLEALREGRRSPEAPLLLTRYRRPGPFTADTFGHWLGPILARVTGRALPPKCLRKTFATWALEAGLDEYRVEAWLGHRAGNVAGVTSRHYLAIIRGRKLQELAAQIDAIVAPLLAGAPPAATRVPATPSASVRSDAG
ncbi:site-specific integrase [bacterium]|nr:site-specific integrase [bacterium]